MDAEEWFIQLNHKNRNASATKFGDIDICPVARSENEKNIERWVNGYSQNLFNFIWIIIFSNYFSILFNFLTKKYRGGESPQFASTIINKIIKMDARAN